MYIYPSLLDSFTNLLNAEETWDKYWGQSANPSISLHDYLVQSKQAFFDGLNRVKTEPIEAADRGTCLNEIVDDIIMNKKSKRCDYEIIDNGKVRGYSASMNGFTFFYPMQIVEEYVKLYRYGIAQVLTSANIETSHGVFNLYGFIDYLNPLSVHDMKTTGSYNLFKFKNHWQHKLYMYCLRENGASCDTFYYDVTVFDKKGGFEFHREMYTWNESYKKELEEICDMLYDFINENRSLVTNENLFVEHEHKH